MEIIQTNLKDCCIIKPSLFGDSRGYFSPYFISEEYKKLGFKEVMQTNRSCSSKNVFRGFHFQAVNSQAKVVEVISGKAVDIVIDLRIDSDTFGQSTYVELKPYDEKDPTSGYQLFVPRYFAHGFVSLEDNTVFQYIVDNKYSPEDESGINYKNKKIKINWEEILGKYNLTLDDLKVSEKDSRW